jgi:hypothetical protein
MERGLLRGRAICMSRSNFAIKTIGVGTYPYSSLAQIFPLVGLEAEFIANPYAQRGRDLADVQAPGVLPARYISIRHPSVTPAFANERNRLLALYPKNWTPAHEYNLPFLPIATRKEIFTSSGAR